MEKFQPFNIAILTNAIAGKGRALKVANEIAGQLSARGIAFRIFSGDWPVHLDGFSDAWIAGGDGTLNYFINKYPHVSIPLSIFKGGTGNDFATELYGNLSPEEQVGRVLSSRAKAVDAALCNERLFLNVTGIGFDGEVLKAMGMIRFLGGFLGYYLGILREIFFFREHHFKIEGDGLIFEGRLFLVMVTNSGTTGGGFRVSPLSSVKDGLLDLIIAKPLSIVKRLLYLPKVQKGNHLALPVVSHHTGEHFTITCKSILPAPIDGEFMPADTFRFSILKNKFLFRY